MNNIKAMVIGISPNYNYPNDFSVWKSNDTYFSSNHGASLICRAIMKQFSADYVDDFTDIGALKSKYNVCFLALATHITSWRDVSFYADLVEKLDLKTIILSLGVEADIQSASNVSQLHPSMKRLLKAVAARSNFIGVRGHYTTALLNRFGFLKVVPIGCPTLYWGLKPTLSISYNAKIERPLLVYHRSFAQSKIKMPGHYDILGQDFLDQVIFTEKLNSDTKLVEMEFKRYHAISGGVEYIETLKSHGKFFDDFDGWFNEIGSHDFIFGPRLHGCIAALLQGKPALLIGRDYRIREITEFFKLPVASFEEIANKSIDRVYAGLDFTAFETTYKLRFANYLSFLKENNLSHNLLDTGNHSFSYSSDDLRVSLAIINSNLGAVQEIQEYRFIKLMKKIDKILLSIPGVRFVYRKLSKEKKQ